MPLAQPPMMQQPQFIGPGQPMPMQQPQFIGPGQPMPMSPSGGVTAYKKQATVSIPNKRLETDGDLDAPPETERDPNDPITERNENQI